MVTQNEARESVYEKFRSEWVLGPNTAFTFEDEDFDSSKVAEFVRITVRQRDSRQESLGPVGSRKYQRRSRMLGQVFTPVNDGVQRGDELATALRDIFEGTSFDQLRFTDVTIREIGPDGKWHLMSVDGLFDYHETK